ncbi:MAG: DUF4880 domain-containing protein [Acidobacteriota bacterium]
MSSGEFKTAAKWMARLRAEQVSQEDRGAYREWLERSPENRAAAAALERIWRWIVRLEGDPLVRAVLNPRVKKPRR